MGKAYCSLYLVNILPTSATRTRKGDLQIGRIDFKFGFFPDRQYSHRCSRCMYPTHLFCRWYSLDPMDTSLKAKLFINILTSYLEARFFISTERGFRFIYDRNSPAF